MTGIAQAGIAHAGMAQAGVAQAGVAGTRWALRLMWRTWVGVVSLMRVPDEGGDRRVPGTSAKAENHLFSARRFEPGLNCQTCRW